MLLGLDGVEIGLIIVFATLFAAILSGFPVAFAIGGAGNSIFNICKVIKRADRSINVISIGKNYYSNKFSISIFEFLS